MKKSNILVSVLFLLLTMSGCTSYSTLISLDIKKPAQYTFPPYVRKIVLVDNAARQPSTAGHRFVVDEGNQYTQEQQMEVKVDQLPIQFVQSVSDAIKSTNYFFSVTADTISYRHDDRYLEKLPIDSLTMARIANQYDADLILILERAPLNCTLVMTPTIDHSLYQAELKTRFRPELSFFYPREQRYDKPLALDDTLSWRALNVDIDNAIASLPNFSEIQKAIVGVQTDRVMRKLLPNTEQQDRLIYSGSDPNLQDAYDYAIQGKWKEAYWIWDFLQGKWKDGLGKAKVLCNLAVYYELNDNFVEALACLDKAQLYLKENDRELRYYIRDYQKVLRSRSKESDKLFNQLGY